MPNISTNHATTCKYYDKHQNKQDNPPLSLRNFVFYKIFHRVLTELMICDEMIHLHGLVKVVFWGFQNPDFHTKAKCKTSHMTMSFISISTKWITFKIKVLAFALVLKNRIKATWK